MGLDTSWKSDWFDVAVRRLRGASDKLELKKTQRLEEAKSRTHIVVRTRWILLSFVGVYCVMAGGFFYFSRFGLFLSPSQHILLLAALAAVVCYNLLLQFSRDRLARGFRLLNFLQIILDLVLVSVLIHTSGGAASWFWPAYLFVTIEASFLIEDRREVWLVGGLGGLLYGAVLVLEHLNIVPYVRMPFVGSELHHDHLYLLLTWLWVSLLNAAMAAIASYFMTVIRRETDAVREGEERLATFLDTANDLIHSVTPDGRLLYVNEAWQRTLGYSAEEADAVPFFDILHPDSREQCCAELQRVVSGDALSPMEAVFTAKDGRSVIVEGSLSCAHGGDESSVIWSICRDITERKHAEEQLYRLAHHDTLTGLPNRILFMDRLQQAKALANRYRYQVAVLFLDLDRFKIINDTLGHPVGDHLLQQVAHRIAGCVREVDTVARIGGDEFTIILVNVDTVEDVKRMGQKILKTLAAPFNIDTHELFVTASIGISLFPSDGDNLDQLVKKADIAMYCVKGEGRNNVQFYSPQMDANADKRLLLETSLRKALDNREFRVYYQPKVDIVSKRITAMEALIRWDHPILGLVSPGEFIPLAEETGLIIPIGEWVLRAACFQNCEWVRQGIPPMRVAVNLSGYQFQQKNLLETIRGILDETGLTADLLELEITESVIMQNPDFAVSVLNQLRDLGVHISIDDFGIGYSSLAHLKRFSVNTLKIDKSFVRDVEINSADAAIATAIIAMGNSLNLKVIAEGVETEGQLSFLSDNKCDEVQGYLFSTPMPPEKVAEFMREHGRSAGRG
ncbi:diguanylate cyclase/phosphodiesterase with PAS/PAC sensor(s) [Geobacter metallireducens RCH3]|uniref:Sensor diguanylate cyclase/phosphodiesterase, PAS domain-containing n=1 Tax=Geobacter metallireducens (strain ATCC 53774 / DSM 7210 / GS-15) TaxID=269799 RepID=Q39WZ5_GEOMG|nr:sensor diguanylate cyclase/phosphodiesterase, PAS domain-containing [Geobacter metallireducens GS-15]EHP84627.1 diguanylate cyclase/phosphodiesterase with PAS/PAC sensor(s) [Geobacter metallireducens RCH3]